MHAVTGNSSGSRAARGGPLCLVTLTAWETAVTVPPDTRRSFPPPTPPHQPLRIPGGTPAARESERSDRFGAHNEARILFSRTEKGRMLHDLFFFSIKWEGVAGAARSRCAAAAAPPPYVAHSQHFHAPRESPGVLVNLGSAPRLPAAQTSRRSEARHCPRRE